MSSLKSKVANSVKHNSIAMILTSGLQVVQLIVLGRILGPAVFGLLALVQIVIQFAQMYMDMGISEAIIQKEKTSKLALSSLYWFSIFVGFLLFIVLLLAAPLVALIFQQGELKGIIQVIAVSFFIIPFGLQFQTIASKNLKFSKIALYDVLATFAGVTITISTAVFLKAGAWSLVYGHIGSSLIRTIPWVYLGFKNPETRPQFLFSWNEIKEYVWFGLYRLGTYTVTFFNTKIDQIVIGVIMGPAVLGFYSMAMNLIMQPIQKINPMINRVVFPVFSKIQNDKKRMQKGYLFIINLLTSINAPLFAGLVVLAPYLVPALLGEEWGEAVLIVQILSFYALFKALGNPSGSLIIAAGKVRWSFYWQLAQLFIVPAVIFFASMTGSIAIVAVAMASLRFVLYFVNYFIRIRHIIDDCLMELLKAIFTPIAHSAIMMAILHVIILQLAGVSNANMVVINTAAGGLIYLLLVLLFQRKLVNDIKGFFVKKVLA